MTTPNTIITARLTLQPAHLTDAPDLHQICSEQQVRARVFQNMIPPRAWLEQLLWTSNTHFEQLKAGLWRVTPSGESRPVGVVGIRSVEAQTSLGPELVVVIHPSCWQMGYGLEATRAVIDHLERHGAEHIEHIHTTLFPKNTQGIALCEALGMKLVVMQRLHHDPKLTYQRQLQHRPF